MTTVTIKISGRDLPVAARLLEALTNAYALADNIAWEDHPDYILLVINDQHNCAKAAFETKRFEVL